MTIDLSAIEAVLATGLPARSRWMLDATPLDFAFSGALRDVPVDVLKFGDAEWAELRVFGGYDYAEGGGAQALLCVHARDGAVCGLDVERDDAVFPLNSSAQSFVAVFQMLDSYLARGLPLPPDVQGRLRALDPDMAAHSDWVSLVT